MNFRPSHLRLATVAIGLLFSQTLWGAQILISNLHSPFPVLNLQGELVPHGSGSITLGSFDATDAEIRSAGSIAELHALFLPGASPVSFGITAGDGVQVGGFFSKDVSAQTPEDHPLVGRKIDLVMGNGSDLASSTAIAIFRSNDDFPVDNPVSTASVRLDGALTNGRFLLGKNVSGVFIAAADASFCGIGLVDLAPRIEVAPALLSIERTGGTIKLTSTPVGLRRVGVEHSATLEPGSFIDIGNFSCVDGHFIFTDPDTVRTSQPRGFYRTFLRPEIP